MSGVLEVSCGLGDRVRSARLRAGLTQAAVAHQMGFGEHGHIKVSLIESEKRRLRASEVLKLAAILHVSSGVLLGLDAMPEPAVVLWCAATHRLEEAAL